MIPVFRGTVKDGKLKVQQRDNFMDYVSRLEGKVVELTLKEPKSLRSTEMNALYWSCLEIISDHTGHSKEELHEYYKHKFLSDKIQVIGEPFTYSRSTAVLKIDEFSKYLNDIKFHAFHEIGVDLPIE